MKLKRNIQFISAEFHEKLYNYDYPGNIRELKNIIERAIILCDGNTLEAGHLPKEFSALSIPGSRSAEKGVMPLEAMEKEHILFALKAAEGNKTRAAEMLGIGLTTLYRKLQMYGLE